MNIGLRCFNPFHDTGLCLYPLKTCRRDRTRFCLQLEERKNKTRQKIDDETGKDVSLDHQYRRAYVPTKKDMYYHKLAYDRIPNVNLRSAKTVAAMKRGAVWEKIANMENIVGIKRDVIEAKAENASYTLKKG